MGIVEKISPRIKNHEGFRKRAYKDSRGIWTFGYGTTVRHMELPEDVAGIIMTLRLHYDLERCYQNFPWFSSMPIDVQGVILEMVYQIGISGFKKFKKTINYLADRNFLLASKEMMNSKWGGEFKTRATMLSDIILECDGT